MNGWWAKPPGSGGLVAASAALDTGEAGDDATRQAMIDRADADD